MPPSFVIKSYPELLALHRVILEAKFSLPMNDDLIVSSPLIAKMAEQIIEVIIELETAQGDEESREKWGRWRQIVPSRREWVVALQQVTHNREYWDSLDTTEKREYARLVLSPFLPTPEIFNEFMKQVEDGMG